LSHGNQWCLSTGDGTEKTWQDAKTYCESQNGTLLNVVNAEMENTLRQFINDSKLFSRDMWIGISAVNPDSEFHWINGQPISSMYEDQD
jgi:Lectin C-type domain